MNKQNIKTYSVILFVFFSVLWASQTAAQTTVILKKSAVVLGPIVTIGEIAEISGGYTDVIDKIKNIQLTPAPQPKVPLQISVQLVRHSLTQNRLLETDVKLAGSDNVLVSVDTVLVNADQLIETARKYLDERIQIPEGTKIITLLRQPPAAIIAPKRDCIVKVTPNIIGRLKGVVSISVGVYNGDRLFQMVPVQFNVRTFEPMVITTRTIQCNAVIQETDVKRIIGESTKYNDDLITDAALVVGQEVKRTIYSEQPVLQGDVLPPTLVKSGDVVEIEVVKGGITITGTGIARRNGRLGEVIPIARANQSAVIQAQVVGEKKVAIK